MSQNGKDTHVRQVQIWGHRESSPLFKIFPTFQSPEFFQYSTIRWSKNKLNPKILKWKFKLCFFYNEEGFSLKTSSPLFIKRGKYLFFYNCLHCFLFLKTGGLFSFSIKGFQSSKLTFFTKVFANIPLVICNNGYWVSFSTLMSWLCSRTKANGIVWHCVYNHTLVFWRIISDATKSRFQNMAPI